MGTPTHSHDRGRADGPDDRRADAGDDPQEIRDIGGDPGDTPASPEGLPFPSVGGTALSGENVRFPDDLVGAPAVLLVAYQRMAHADVSSWREFLEAREPGLTVYEVPTIPAIAFRSWASWIDNCMRKGVPEASWPRIVTLYGDGPPVQDLLGHNDFAGAVVVLLDAGGVVRWFGHGGFTPEMGGGLRDRLHRLADQPPD